MIGENFTRRDMLPRLRIVSLPIITSLRNIAILSKKISLITFLGEDEMSQIQLMNFYSFFAQ